MSSLESRSSKNVSELSLLSRCHLKLAQYCQSSAAHSVPASSLLEHLHKATNLAPDSYKAYDAASVSLPSLLLSLAVLCSWHHWALLNYQRVEDPSPSLAVSSSSSSSTSSPASVSVGQHVVPALSGFFRAIALGDGSNRLQNTLRILNLVFRYIQCQLI